MKYPTLIPSSSQLITLDKQQTQSLYELCRQFDDGRAARGKRYPLAALLTLVLVAKLAGMKNLLAASEWIADQQQRLCEHLGVSWKRMPSTNTYASAFARAESEHMGEEIAAWLTRLHAQRRCGNEPSRLHSLAQVQGTHLAIDGKVLKGTGTHCYGQEEAQTHLLHVYEVQTGIVLHQVPIASDRNELSTLKPLLTRALCQGRVLTADAAQSYYEFGHLVQRAGGDMILFIKENTPLTREDLKLFFARSTRRSSELADL